MVNVVSEKRKLIVEDLKKVGKGALIAGVGAGLFYALEALPQVNFGEKWTPIVVAFLGITTNLIRKWWNENNY